VDIVILDTSVLLDDPEALFAFPGRQVVLPAVVLEEIDGKKHLHNELGSNAREVARLLDSFRSRGSLQEGVSLPEGGLVRVELNHKSLFGLQDNFMEPSNDNRILAVALNLAEEASRITLVSQDSLMRVKADALGIASEPYNGLNPERRLFTGVVETEVDPETIDAFYQQGWLGRDETGHEQTALYPNQFALLRDNRGLGRSALARFDGQKWQKLRQLTATVWGISAKNVHQRMALDLLLDDSVPLVTLSGKAGTGKTLLSLACSLQKTQQENVYQKLLITRPVVPLGRDLGYLPGDKDEKMAPWMRAVYDNLEYLFRNRRDYTMDQILCGIKNLEVAALAYLRGRSLPGQFIIVDEAQNLTVHEAKTIISRVGENTKVVLLGDPEQIDHPYLDYHNNGLSRTVEAFKDQSLSGHIHLAKGERSALASLAAHLL